MRELCLGSFGWLWAPISNQNSDFKAPAEQGCEWLDSGLKIQLIEVKLEIL